MTNHLVRRQQCGTYAEIAKYGIDELQPGNIGHRNVLRMGLRGGPLGARAEAQAPPPGSTNQGRYLHWLELLRRDLVARARLLEEDIASRLAHALGALGHEEKRVYIRRAICAIEK